MQHTLGSKRRGAGGFTLVELMVTVVIGSILLAVAVPSYTYQVRKSRRTDARSALLDLASREERYLTLNNSYTNVAANLGYAGWPQTVGSGYYQVQTPTVNAATANSPATFTLVAIPVGSQLKDSSCQYFSVDNTGNQQSFNNSSGTGTNTTSTCWN
jgi:type IV pilus assembly protein PilE